MDIDVYFLSDLPTQKKEKIDDINRNKSAKLSRHVPLLTKRASINNEIMKSFDKQQFFTINSIAKSECIFIFS